MKDGRQSGHRTAQLLAHRNRCGTEAEADESDLCLFHKTPIQVGAVREPPLHRL